MISANTYIPVQSTSSEGIRLLLVVFIITIVMMIADVYIYAYIYVLLPISLFMCAIVYFCYERFGHSEDNRPYWWSQVERAFNYQLPRSSVGSADSPPSYDKVIETKVASISEALPPPYEAVVSQYQHYTHLPPSKPTNNDDNVSCIINIPEADITDLHCPSDARNH